MTSPSCRRRRTPMCSVCISATAASHGASESGAFGSRSTRSTRRSLTAAARQSTSCCHASTRESCSERGASKSGCARNIGRVCFLSTVLARSICGRSGSNPGSKHSSITATEEFILGLIHSDGCRVVANDRGVKSVRYHFSNMSEDIHGLFTAALDALGIPWTRSSKKIVSIYRKAATARLDEFVGPKDRAVPLNGVHYTA